MLHTTTPAVCNPSTGNPPVAPPLRIPRRRPECPPRDCPSRRRRGSVPLYLPGAPGALPRPTIIRRLAQWPA